MKLFARKPCSFSGKKFFIGDEIPSDYVSDPKAQEKMGVLVVVEENSGNADSVEGGALLPPSSTLVSVPILAEEGIVSVEITPEELVEVVTIIQMSDEELAEKVKEIDSEDQLLLIAVLNGGDVAYEATKARVEELGLHIYTESELSHKVKEELLEIAEIIGVETKSNMKKEEIIGLILEKQGE